MFSLCPSTGGVTMEGGSFRTKILPLLYFQAGILCCVYWKSFIFLASLEWLSYSGLCMKDALICEDICHLSPTTNI